MKKRELFGMTAAIALAISPAVAFAADNTTGGVAKTGTGGPATVQQAQDTSDENVVTGLYIGAGVLGTAGLIAGLAGGDNSTEGGTTSTSTSTATSTAAPQ